MSVAQINEVKYLIMVNPGANNNKFYRMIPHGGSFTVEYGRVGATGMKKDYPISLWYKKYQEKMNNGYQDQTELHQEIVLEKADSKYAPIQDKSVNNIVERMMNWANEKIKKSYNVQTKSVTKDMISSAQRCINRLTYTSSVYQFNEILCELFTVLPRKMSNVSCFLAKGTNDFERIIRDEQDLLDVMIGQVNQISVSSTDIHSKGKLDKTILEAMGFDMRPCTKDEIENIKSHLSDESVKLFKNAWRVENKRTEKAFNEYCENRNIHNIKMYFHGSRNENFWSIVTNGMSLNPNAVITGKMFGYGLYFAPRAKKSINYTSLNGSYWARGNSNTGLLAVFKVAEGNCLDVNSHKSEYLSYKEKDIIAKGKDSLYAHAGVSLYNDEVIVYNEAAVNLRYIIELEE